MNKVLIGLLFISSSVFADTGTFTFIPPTEREDNTPLPANEIGGYHVFMNTDPVKTLLPGATGFTLNIPSGDHVVGVTCFDTDGRESTVVTLPVRVLSSPKPVTGLSVTLQR